MVCRPLRFIVLMAVLVLASRVSAWSMGEPFDYSTGDVTSVSSGLWTNWTSGSLPANVVTYASGDTRLQLVSGTSRSSNSVMRNIPPNDGLVYLRAKINVQALPASGTGDYFLCLKDAAGNARARVFITSPNATNNTYKLGVAFAQATSPTAQWATALNAGTDYILVMKLDTTAKVATLWVDVATDLDNMTESGTTHITSSDASSAISPTAVGFRQPNTTYGGIGTIDIDDLLVGESWNEVVGELFDVTQYGAVPNSPGTDCQPGIQAAINAARVMSNTNHHHSIVVLPTNTYYITGQNVQTVGSGFTIMYINNILQNFVLDGSGSNIQMQSAANTGYYVVAGPAYLANCTGVTVKEFNIDWTRPPFTVATVTSTPVDLGASGSYTHQWQFTVSVDSGYPLPADTTDVHRWDVTALTDMDPATGLPIGNLKVIDGASGTSAGYVTGTLTATGTSTILVRTISNTSTQEGSDRLTHLGLTMASLSGKKVLLRHPMWEQLSNGSWVNKGVYGPECFSVNGGGGNILHDINIYACTGMGMHTQQCNTISLNRVNLAPSNGRLLSTLADGTFFTYCQGTVSLANCLYQATGDDSANVNSKYLEVTDINGTTLTMETDTLTSPTPTWPGAAPVPGEQFEFFTRDTQSVYTNGSSNFVATVQSGTVTNNVVTVTFDAIPPTLKKTDHALTQAYSPVLNVTNCTFNGGLARGLIVSTNNTTVTNSTFENIVYSGIQCVSYPVASGDQGPAVNNLTVTGCTFAGCGAADIATFAPSGAYSGGGNPARTSVIGLFQNFTITNNAFNPESSSGINALRLLTSTRGVVGQDPVYNYNTSSVMLAALGGTNTVNDNVFNNNNTAGGYYPAVVLTHTQGVSLIDNEAPSGQQWLRTYYQAGGNDPVPNFGSTPTSGPIDYLVAPDEMDVSGGVPTTADGALINYIVQIGGIQ